MSVLNIRKEIKKKLKGKIITVWTHTSVYYIISSKTLFNSVLNVIIEIKYGNKILASQRRNTCFIYYTFLLSETIKIMV